MLYQSKVSPERKGWHVVCDKKLIKYQRFLTNTVTVLNFRYFLVFITVSE